MSVLLKPGLLESVMESFEEVGVVLDERKPDVIRVAPAPLYNTYTDVYDFIQHFREACEKAVTGRKSHAHSIMVDGGKDSHGWSEIK